MKKATAVLLALCFCSAVLSTAVFAADDILLIAPAPIAPAPIAPAPIAPAPMQGGYTDVPGDHWAKEAINHWTDMGVLKGNPDGTFAPDERMTPAQFLTFLSRALKLATADLGVLDGYENIDPAAWYAQTLANCVGAGIMGGVFAPSFDPDGVLTREQAAVLVCRAYGIEPLEGVTPNYIDAFEISADAMPYVAALTGSGALKGYPDKTLRAQSSLTRAEAVVFVTRAGENRADAGEYELSVKLETVSGQSRTIGRSAEHLTSVSGIAAELFYIAGADDHVFRGFFADNELADAVSAAVAAFNAGGRLWQDHMAVIAQNVTDADGFMQLLFANAPVSELEAGMSYSMLLLGKYRLTVTVFAD